MPKTIRSLGIALSLVGAIIFGHFISLQGARPQHAIHPPDNEHLIPAMDGPTLYMTYCAVCHGKVADGRDPWHPFSECAFRT